MAKIVRVVVQARMASSRLPGKIVKPLAGKPILLHVVERMQAAGQRADAIGKLESTPVQWEVLVATSTASLDEATERLCRQLGVACCRGPEHDVLSRYVMACEGLRDDDLVVRATADNPLYCPKRAVAIVAEHLQSGADYTSIKNLSYVVPEVMRCGALRAMDQLARDPDCREHVTPYFRQTPGRFRVSQLPPAWMGLRPDIRLTVDTQAEYARMGWIFEALGGKASLFSLQDVYALCHAR